MDVGNLISGSSPFSKSSLNICKFLVHILLKPGLTHASPGDTQTLKDRPAQSFVGSLCPGVDKVLFEPSEYSGRYGDDSLNEP